MAAAVVVKVTVEGSWRYGEKLGPLSETPQIPKPGFMHDFLKRNTNHHQIEIQGPRKIAKESVGDGGYEYVELCPKFVLMD